MTPQRHRLLFWFKVLLVTLFAMAAVTVVLRWHRIFPSHETSELYRRYENHEHIDVSFVKDFHVNDTVSVDVTILEAKDDSTWMTMRKDFRVLCYTQENNTSVGKDISYRYAPKSNYSATADTTDLLNNDCIAINHTERTICVFHIADEKTQKTIEHLIFQHMLKRTSLKIKQ